MTQPFVSFTIDIEPFCRFFVVVKKFNIFKYLLPGRLIRRVPPSKRKYFYVGVGALVFVLTPLIIAELFFLKDSRAAWPSAQRAYGSESLMNYYFFLGTYFVYLLKSRKDATYYIGQADNVVRRLNQHNSGQVSSTKSRLPWKLIGYEAYLSCSQSMWREHKLKTRGILKKAFILEMEVRHA